MKLELELGEEQKADLKLWSDNNILIEMKKCCFGKVQHYICRWVSCSLEELKKGSKLVNKSPNPNGKLN